MSDNKKQKIMQNAHHLRRLAYGDGINLTIEELLQLLPSSVDKEDILKQARSQDKGIPSEYQFGAICWWLGKCKHFQFIDTQPEFPYLSKIENVKYPDAFAIFNYNNRDFPCFIQIKSNNKRLKMNKKYVSGLKNYPLLKGYPLLIAWKWREFWVLFDIDTFISESGEINVKFEDVGGANMMSVLCGDFLFSGIKKDIESYVVLKPSDEIELKNYKNKKDFNGICMDLCFYGIPYNKDINTYDFETEKSRKFSLIIDLSPFLGFWEPFDRFDGKHIYMGERVSETYSMLASQVLPYIFYHRANINRKQKVDWESILRFEGFDFTIDDVLEMIRIAQIRNMGFENIIHFLPGISNPCMEKLH